MPFFSLVRRQGHAPSRGTSADFRHGRDWPITHSRIEQENLRRAADDKPPLTAAECVKLFVHFPKQRHFERADRLIKPARIAA